MLTKQYTEKLGIPLSIDNNRVIVDLQMRGVASAFTTNSSQFVIYSEAAMRAQEQGRKTLQTLHDIKNPKPRTVFIRNVIAQQVNQLITKTEELQKQLEA